MKDILKGAGIVLVSGILAIGFGWMLGSGASWWILNLHGDQSAQQERPVWFCIEGKIYEKIDQVYVTVSPDRACLPVDKK